MSPELTSQRVLSLALGISVLIQIIQAYTIHAVRIVVEERGLTCWTCPNKSDNEACNNWAPDIECPTNRTVCQTFHRIDVRRQMSLMVHKRCAREDECNEEHVGCFQTENPAIQECVSCCTEAYCNEQVPTNHTMAILLSNVFNSGSRTRMTWHTFSGGGIYAACLLWWLTSISRLLMEPS